MKTVTKIIIRVVCGIILAVAVLCAAYFGFRKFTKVRYDKSIALIDHQLSLCQELVTAKYRYSDIITIKKSAGFSKSYSIIKYSGIIRAGIADFTDIYYSISPDGKSVYLEIPQAEMLGNEITTQEVFDEKQSIFVPITTQEIFDEIKEAKNQAAEDMIAEGILKEARDYAVKIISQSMYACGFEQVVVAE